MSGVPARSEAASVELYVRSLSPRDSRRRIESIVDRLDGLTTTDALGDYRVVPTGRELPPTPADAITDYGAYLLGRLAVFQEWARTTGRSVDDLFERRTVRSSFTGEEHDALTLPTVVMAEYQGADLRFVTPCQDGDDHVTVCDRLTALESGEALPQEDRLPRARGSPPFAVGGTETGRDADDSTGDGTVDWPTPGTGQ